MDKAIVDRALGSLAGMACGDALGAGYEFQPPFGKETAVSMIGGGLGDFEIGEWTDDTSMAIVIAQVLSDQRSELNDQAMNQMVRAWAQWAKNAPDVGNQTRSVLKAAQEIARRHEREELSWQDSVQASALVHERTGRSGGNGSLMRTAPVALAFLSRSRQDVFDASVQISKLTHYDYEAAEACGLWSVAIHHAISTGELDLRASLDLLEPARAEVWKQRIALAEAAQTSQFPNNGWVVEALQSAWCAISTTKQESPQSHLVDALEAAVRGGVDTDTVAAIAGSLIGAAYGESAILEDWKQKVHGWPGLDYAQLLQLARTVIG